MRPEDFDRLTASWKVAAKTATHLADAAEQLRADLGAAVPLAPPAAYGVLADIQASLTALRHSTVAVAGGLSAAEHDEAISLVIPGAPDATVDSAMEVAQLQLRIAHHALASALSAYNSAATALRPIALTTKKED